MPEDTTRTGHRAQRNQIGADWEASSCCVVPEVPRSTMQAAGGMGLSVSPSCEHLDCNNNHGELHPWVQVWREC